MRRINLNGDWRLYHGQGTCSASVPGSVYADLLAAGKMEDPFWRDNELAALELMKTDYVYEREFDVDADFLKNRPTLCCEGLDTLAEIYLNGELLAKTNNMHRRYELPVTPKEGENHIQIIFRSPTRYISDAYRSCRVEGTGDAMRGFPHLRKAHCMFGWDWGPRLPDAGIWRDIYLVSGEGRIGGVYVRQKHSEGTVTLNLEAEHTGGELRAVLSDENGVVAEGFPEMTVEKPCLWWPNGYGEQSLYNLNVDLLDSAGNVLDSWSARVGLRTVTVSREKDEWGEEFAVTVNGLKIFAMGADYIPEDNILPRMNPERTRVLLNDCVLANFNSVRVWGGGIYPPDYFFDICDELGLLVWQDFMFACAMYELTPEFEETVRAEIEDNVKRLRNHASLAMWCGNNEMEDGVNARWYDYTPKQKSYYTMMYEYIFPQIVNKHDPDRFYWPSSPSSGGGFDAPNDENRGDVHYWDVWHGLKPFTEYRKFYFRFASEFGFQSFPDIKTIESFTEPSDRNIFSYVFEKHQRNSTANGRIMAYMGLTYLYPANLETLIYASQLLQADAIAYGVTHWRRNRGRCMGAIYWQLNDCWPVASWASIDYFGRWKALHYYAKRFFAPVLLSCEESPFEPNPNAEPYEQEKSARLCVSNETAGTVAGTVEWRLLNARAEVLKQGSHAVSVPPYQSMYLDKMDFPEINAREHYLSFSLSVNGEAVSSGSVLFCPPKHFEFVNPNLSVTREGDLLTVSAEAYAKSVEIYSQDGDFVLTDNFFDIDAGTKTVGIIRGSADSFAVRSVYDIGRN